MNERDNGLELTAGQIRSGVEAATKLMRDPRFRDSAGTFVTAAHQARIRMPGPEISRDAITPKVSPPPQLKPNEVEALEAMLSNYGVRANLSPTEVDNYRTIVGYNIARSGALTNVRANRREFLMCFGALGTTLGVTGASSKILLSASDDERGAYVRADTDSRQALSGDPRNLHGRLPSNVEEHTKAQELQKTRIEMAYKLVDDYKKPRAFISGVKTIVGSIGIFVGVIGSFVAGIITAMNYPYLLRDRREAKTKLYDLDSRYSRLLSPNPPTTNRT